MSRFCAEMVAVTWWAGGEVGRAALALPRLVGALLALALATVTDPAWLPWLLWQWSRGRSA